MDIVSFESNRKKISITILISVIIFFLYTSLNSVHHRVSISGFQSFPNTLLDWFALSGLILSFVMIVVSLVGVVLHIKASYSDK